MAATMAPAATDGLATPSASMARVNSAGGEFDGRLTETGDGDVDAGLEVDQDGENGGLIAS